ncbi:hypothetical protein [Lutibaculum baratangense]|uniref:HTH cro/C1-type domain-containing protein n=1 Tax=Lutibaculum baratangense AMV1 TaxID=631454 RepID=V4RGQ7_9HYPH|nr:hypothetical protein [Lutibaculum baratangense]ESR25336.1 hypothetical protein N177_1853 [Lutibaculum baratangense AMV1]
MRKKAVYDVAIAHVLRKLHDEGHIPRDVLAKALDVPELELTRIELGSEPLSAGGLVMLLEFSKLSWDEFLGRVQAELPAAEKSVR